MTTMNRPVTVASAMFAVHAMFRREFGRMSSLVRAVAVGDTQRATLVADHIALVSGVMSQHDWAEDRHTWPLLRERCPEECTSVLDVVEGQHQDVGRGLLQVEEAQESWRDSASARTRDALADSIDRLIPVINEHLALEEERVVPLIEKHISRAEYAVSVNEQAAAIPPGMLPTVWGMVMYGCDPAVGDMVLSKMPVEVQPVIKDMAVKAHAIYARELYRTVRHSRVTGGSLAGHDGKRAGVDAV
jgi:Hemerythrin HHE cation binding domain